MRLAARFPRPVRSALALALSVLLALAAVPAAPVSAQPSPSASADSALPCTPQTVPLGAIGRATVVSFTGAVFAENVCALTANLAFDLFRARFTDAPSTKALVIAALTPGSGALVSTGRGYSLSAAAVEPNAPQDLSANTLEAGPFIIAPGGQLAVAGGDTNEAARVILAFSGQRVLLIRMSPVTLVDAARILRDRPGLFGADAIERAVVLASGPNATLQIAAPTAILGSRVNSAQVLEISAF